MCCLSKLSVAGGHEEQGNGKCEILILTGLCYDGLLISAKAKDGAEVGTYGMNMGTPPGMNLHAL